MHWLNVLYLLSLIFRSSCPPERGATAAAGKQASTPKLILEDVENEDPTRSASTATKIVDPSPILVEMEVQTKIFYKYRY